VALSPEDRTEIAALMDARLKLTRHENDDHLDRALLVQKLKPSATDGDMLYTSSGSTVWAAASAHNHDSRYHAYHVVDTAVGRSAGAGTTTVYCTRDGVVNFAATAGSDRAMFYINVPDLAPGSGGTSFTVKLRAWVLTEADPTDSNVTVSLFQITSIGATGTLSGTSTIGSATVSSVNAATTMYTGESTTLTINTSGWYAVGFLHSTAPATTLTYGYSLLARAT
jgi:hypothetical protein